LIRTLWIDEFDATPTQILRPARRVQPSGHAQFENFLIRRVCRIPCVDLGDRLVDWVVAGDRTAG
jgi:hypothetical protein